MHASQFWIFGKWHFKRQRAKYFEQQIFKEMCIKSPYKKGLHVVLKIVYKNFPLVCIEKVV